MNKFPSAASHDSGAAIRPASVSDRSHPVGHASGGEGNGERGQPGQSDAHGPDAGGNPAKQGAPAERVESPQPCDPFKCDWKEVYYGYECRKCGCFVAFGCEPWAPDDDHDSGDGSEDEDE